jgi:acylphosphatase
VTVRKRVVVSGQVQGVFFRDSCRRRAQQLGVGGWATNTSSGEVEACFEGEEGAVDEMVEWCRTGPEGADVGSVEVHDEQPEGIEDFTVR